jgi:hypothetical protein
MLRATLVCWRTDMLVDIRDGGIIGVPVVLVDPVRNGFVCK